MIDPTTQWRECKQCWKAQMRFVEELSPEEVRKALQDAGYDPQASWELFVKKNESLMARVLGKGITEPGWRDER